MFSGIGIWEVVLIIVVVLVVLGPQRVPEIARKLGQAMRYLRKASTDITTAITKELDTQDKSLSKPTATPKQPAREEKPANPPSTGNKASASDQLETPGGTSTEK